MCLETERSEWTGENPRRNGPFAVDDGFVEALKVFGQPELMATDVEDVRLEDVKGDTETSVVVAPVSRATK